ncbi:MAG: hypothetical protein Ct9H90mP25_4860 [Gammaproteobacteria bacterium]|nr:MAG: hypothetical protein Ct9H90mP25_4860 [Gammaproteobacteria bacterium]
MTSTTTSVTSGAHIGHRQLKFLYCFFCLCDFILRHLLKIFFLQHLIAGKSKTCVEFYFTTPLILLIKRLDWGPFIASLKRLEICLVSFLQHAQRQHQTHHAFHYLGFFQKYGMLDQKFVFDRFSSQNLKTRASTDLLSRKIQPTIMHELLRTSGGPTDRPAERNIREKLRIFSAMCLRPHC